MSTNDKEPKARPYLPRLWATKEHSRFIRTTTLVWMMWLTSKIFVWVMQYVETTQQPPLEVAAVVGAVLAPLAGLHGAIFKFYNTSPYTNGSY